MNRKIGVRIIVEFLEKMSEVTTGKIVGRTNEIIIWKKYCDNCQGFLRMIAVKITKGSNVGVL